eukprot:6182114-Pleurochrysis_carterae.AAC.6
MSRPVGRRMLHAQRHSWRCWENIIRKYERWPECIRQMPRELIGHLTTLNAAPDFDGSGVHCNALLGTAHEYLLAAKAEFTAEQRKIKHKMTNWE